MEMLTIKLGRWMNGFQEEKMQDFLFFHMPLSDSDNTGLFDCHRLGWSRLENTGFFLFDSEVNSGMNNLFSSSD